MIVVSFKVIDRWYFQFLLLRKIYLGYKGYINENPRCLPFVKHEVRVSTKKILLYTKVNNPSS